MAFGDSLHVADDMTVSNAKWLLRVGLAAVSVLVAVACGKSIAVAFGAVALSGVAIVLMGAPLSVIAVIFMPVLSLYGLKMFSRDEPELDLRDPDTVLFLSLGLVATVVMVGIIALSLSK